MITNLFIDTIKNDKVTKLHQKSHYVLPLPENGVAKLLSEPLMFNFLISEAPRVHSKNNYLSNDELNSRLNILVDIRYDIVTIDEIKH